MAKKVKALVKLQIIAGAANPSPPIGPALGQQGVNIVEFCKQFNKQTASMEAGLLIPVVVTVYVDRSFSFIIKTPPTVVLLKKLLGITSGSDKPKIVIVSKVLRSQIYDIARMKATDMTGSNIDAIFRCISGTARSMGLEVVED